jgi:RNase P subunit RPR2
MVEGALLARLGCFPVSRHAGHFVSHGTPETSSIRARLITATQLLHQKTTVTLGMSCRSGHCKACNTLTLVGLCLEIHTFLTG